MSVPAPRETICFVDGEGEERNVVTKMSRAVVRVYVPSGAISNPAPRRGIG